MTEKNRKIRKKGSVTLTESKKKTGGFIKWQILHLIQLKKH